jgi:hypothetical protein
VSTNRTCVRACEGTIVRRAAVVYPVAHVLSDRFTQVRKILDDPAYAPWFMMFSGKGNYTSPDCDNDCEFPIAISACSCRWRQ